MPEVWDNIPGAIQDLMEDCKTLEKSYAQMLGILGVEYNEGPEESGRRIQGMFG